MKKEEIKVRKMHIIVTKHSWKRINIFCYLLPFFYPHWDSNPRQSSFKRKVVTEHPTI